MRWCLVLLAWSSAPGWSQSGGAVVMTEAEAQEISRALEASETALTVAQAELERLRADLERLSSESELLKSELMRLSSERVSAVTGQLEGERTWRWVERLGWAVVVVAALVWGASR